jgi:hypothetical protein
MTAAVSAVVQQLVHAPPPTSATTTAAGAAAPPTTASTQAAIDAVMQLIAAAAAAGAAGAGAAAAAGTAAAVQPTQPAAAAATAATAAEAEHTTTPAPAAGETTVRSNVLSVASNLDKLQAMSETVLQVISLPGSVFDGKGHVLGELRDGMLLPSCYVVVRMLHELICDHVTLDFMTGCWNITGSGAWKTVRLQEGFTNCCMKVMFVQHSNQKYPVLQLYSTRGWGRNRVKFVSCARFMCWLLRGPPAAKLFTHHACSCKTCVNPFHLQWVTASQNCVLPQQLRAARAARAAVQDRDEKGRFLKRART